MPTEYTQKKIGALVYRLTITEIGYRYTICV